MEITMNETMFDTAKELAEALSSYLALTAVFAMSLKIGATELKEVNEFIKQTERLLNNLKGFRAIMEITPDIKN